MTPSPMTISAVSIQCVMNELGAQLTHLGKLNFMTILTSGCYFQAPYFVMH